MFHAPPDPGNRIAFDAFLDHSPAHRMSLRDIESEMAHWAAWLASHEAVGREPDPGRGLAIAGYGLGIAGGCFTLAGVTGWAFGTIGDIATTGGIVSLICGMFVAARSEEAVKDFNEANTLVAFRLEELIHRAEQLGGSP